MKELTSREEVDALLAADRAVVFKYSTRCAVSMFASMEMHRFEEAHPDVPLFGVDVLARREVSRHVAEATGVAHHSPQLLVLAHGAPQWTVTHGGVTARALEKALERRENPDAATDRPPGD